MKVKNSYIFGKEINKASWGADEIAAICAKARGKTAQIKKVPRDYIVNTLAKTGRLFADKNSKFRKAAVSHLKENISFSPKMIEESVNLLPGILSSGEMLKRMDMDLFLPYALENPIERRGYDGLIKAEPRGVALHVGAGNVFLGLIDSLVLGILTKNANIVKTPSGASDFPVIFAKALEKCDERKIIAGSLAVLNWKGGRDDLEKEVLNRVDAVLVWGGEQAVSSYQRKAPAGVKVMGFGPKTSMGIAFKSALESKDGLLKLAEDVAQDAGMWDQSACSSLHTLYILESGERERKKITRILLPFLKKAFAGFQKRLPQGKLSDDEKVEITKARELARVDEAIGEGFSLNSFPKTDWTIIFEKNPSYRISPLNRVLYIKFASSLDEIKKAVKPYRGYIQTVGVAGTMEERKKVLSVFGDMSVARVVNSGKMLEGVSGSPHDGIFPMMGLINWIAVEERPGQVDRISELVKFARKRSSFYARYYAKFPEIKSLEDFEKLPFLEKNHIYDNTPPESSAMLTGKVERGVYFASGGSTGSPKYIFYDWHEYDHTARLLGYTLEAAGLDETDLIANLFVAGNFWSSWISVEKALSYTKAISVPIGSSLPVENITKYLEEFKVSAIIGLPSFLVRLAEYARENRKALNLKIKKIFYGGEYVGDEMVKFFKKCFPGCSVRSAGFATADGGVIGFQCPHCERGQHHLFDNSQHIEFINSETLKPVKKGETGELVITSLVKKKMPIIRFRLGDLGRWGLKPCKCGRREPLFEVLGRADDRIHVGGAHLFVSDVQNAIGKVKELSFNFQLLIEKKGYRDFLTMAVEVNAEKNLKKSVEIKKKLEMKIYAHCGDLRESVKMKWLDPPKIQLLKPGVIERVKRTGKIRRVIDKRIRL